MKHVAIVNTLQHLPQLGRLQTAQENNDLLLLQLIRSLQYGFGLVTFSGVFVLSIRRLFAGGDSPELSRLSRAAGGSGGNVEIRGETNPFPLMPMIS